MNAECEMLRMQKKIQNSKFYLCKQAESCKGSEKMLIITLRKEGLQISVCLFILPCV